jgi:hypothetical protein
VAVDQARFQFLNRTPHRERLAEDVDTVAVFIDHLLHACQVALNVAEALDGVGPGFGFVGFVTVMFVCVVHIAIQPVNRILK